MEIANHDILARFGNIVRARRLSLGMTQEALAEKAELHRTYVGDIERGTRNVSLRNIERLALALECSIPALIADIENDVK